MTIVCHVLPDYDKTMTILFRTIQLAVPVILLAAPFLFYRRKGTRALAFYVSMAIEPKSRKTYMLVLAISVLVFNYTFFSLDGASLWLVPGVLLGFVLLRYSFTDAMLHWLGEGRVIQGIAFGGAHRPSALFTERIDGDGPHRGHVLSVPGDRPSCGVSPVLLGNPSVQRRYRRPLLFNTPCRLQAALPDT